MSKQELWIGGYGPLESAHSRGLATFRAVVEESTGGEINVRVTWNIMESGRPNTDLLDLVQSGEMFMCYFSSTYLGARVPALNVLETPYLFDNSDQAHCVLDGELGQRLAAEVRAVTEFELLGFWDNGIRHFSNRLRPVRAPSDCAGMTVRVQPNPVHEELMRSWGAQPVPVELSEGIRLITGLKIDAQENPLANTVLYGVDAVHPYVTMTAHLFGARALLVSQNSMSSLPSDVSLVVADAVLAAIETQRKAVAVAEETYRSKMIARGIRFVDLDEHEITLFRDASQPAVRLVGETVAPDLQRLASAQV